jgi:DNA ligase 1
MQLARLVDAVNRVRATTKKSEKIRLLAETLRQTSGQETALAALYLSGALPQGKIGIGWNLIQKSMQQSSGLGEPLTLLDVDRMLGALASERGSGSTERRVIELGKLFSRATPEEQRFLAQLLIGELRQGALEGCSSMRLPLQLICRRLTSGRPLCSPRTSASWHRSH